MVTKGDIVLKNVGYYARVSTEEEQQLNALKNQIEMLENYINSQDEWRLVDRYIDEGETATTANNRKEYLRLYEDINTDKIDIVIIKDETRLNRHPLHWYEFIDRLTRNEKQLFLLSENKFYSPDDEFIMGIKAGMARQYSRDLSKKILNAHRHRELKGSSIITNGKMWGYRQVNKQLEIDEEEAKIVRFIFNQYIAGDGFRKIQTSLDGMGIKNRNNKPFSMSTLKRIIRQEKYMGTLVCNKTRKNFDTKKNKQNSKEEWIIHENRIPPIVTKEVWEKANKILESKRTYKNNANMIGRFTGLYPLSGKIICGKCGRKYYHTKYKTMKDSVWECQGYRVYGKNNPNGCDNHKVSFSLLEEKTKESIERTIKDAGDIIDHSIKALEVSLSKKQDFFETNTIEKKITQLNKKKDRLFELYSENIIKKDDFQIKYDEYNSSIEELENKIREIKAKEKGIKDKLSRLLEMRNVIVNRTSKEGMYDKLIKNSISEIIVKEDGTFDITVSFEYLNVSTLRYLWTQNDTSQIYIAI